MDPVLLDVFNKESEEKWQGHSLSTCYRRISVILGSVLAGFNCIIICKNLQHVFPSVYLFLERHRPRLNDVALVVWPLIPSSSSDLLGRFLTRGRFQPCHLKPSCPTHKKNKFQKRFWIFKLAV